MIPTKANSEHTRRIGLCLDTRAESSFSRCSGAIADSAVREGGPRADDNDDITTGVNVLGNLRCNADIIWTT
jgi:hypothetical protein